MSGTRHLEVRDAVHQVLAGGLGLPAEDVIAGRRTRPVPEQTLQQVFVYLDFAKPERADLSGMPDDWMTRIRIECAAREGEGLTGEQRADDLASRCYALVAADLSLGGRLIDMVPLGLAWDSDEADVSMGVTQVLFDAKHRTPSADISAP